MGRSIRLSAASYRKKLQHLGWAVGYSVLALPPAAGTLAPPGIMLPPAVGALLISFSTVIGALNAQLLRGLDLQRAPASGAPDQGALRRPTAQLQKAESDRAGSYPPGSFACHPVMEW